MHLHAFAVTSRRKPNFCEPDLRIVPTLPVSATHTLIDSVQNLTRQAISLQCTQARQVPNVSRKCVV